MSKTMINTLSRTAIEGRIAVENLMNALRVDLNPEAAPFELEQHG